MATRQVIVQRFSVTSSKPFRDVVAAFEAAIGHPDMISFSKNIAAAKTFAEVERIVQGACGPSGLMEFTRMDLGAVLRKKNGAAAPNSMRFIVGNPVIMSQMLQQVPDAGSYAPVTVLIDERKDGTYVSYDRMTSFLDIYGNPEALKVARDLDAKIEALLTTAAR
jgi:uncharacterized protein (DUF302 family)